MIPAGRLLRVAALAALGLAAAAPSASAAGQPVPRVGSSFPADTGARVRVGTRAYLTIGDALAAAGPGDTVVVGPGIYHERLRIGGPVVLVGRGRPVVDGGGEGHIVEILAPCTVRGFLLRRSGVNPEREDAGIMARVGPVRIEDNWLEDVQYGIYLKDAGGSVVRGNVVRGKPLPLARRGDGIRLWHSSGSRIVGNDVRGARDVVVFFSDRLVIRGNRVRDGRYGLHYMYSNHNRIVENRLEDNEVGAFLMYSNDIELERNVFGRSSGSSGFGIGLKDADSIRAVDNLFAANQVGVYLDNSPHSVGVRNVFRRNLFLYNQTGVRLLPSVHDNRFEANDFVDNDRPTDAPGGAVPGAARQNDWTGNHWSAYVGFDRNGDGVGDTPFSYARLTDDLVSRDPALRLFAWSPAFPVLDLLSRFFPLLRPVPLVVDTAPRLDAVALRLWEEAPPVETEPAPRRAGVSPWAFAWMAVGGGALAGAWKARPRRRR